MLSGPEIATEKFLQVLGLIFQPLHHTPTYRDLAERYIHILQKQTGLNIFVLIFERISIPEDLDRYERCIYTYFKEFNTDYVIRLSNVLLERRVKLDNLDVDMKSLYAHRCLIEAFCYHLIDNCKGFTKRLGPVLESFQKDCRIDMKLKDLHLKEIFTDITPKQVEAILEVTLPYI